MNAINGGEMLEYAIKGFFFACAFGLFGGFHLLFQYFERKMEKKNKSTDNDE